SRTWTGRSGLPGAPGPRGGAWALGFLVGGRCEAPSGLSECSAPVSRELRAAAELSRRCGIPSTVFPPERDTAFYFAIRHGEWQAEPKCLQSPSSDRLRRRPLDLALQLAHHGD